MLFTTTINSFNHVYLVLVYATVHFNQCIYLYMTIGHFFIQCNILKPFNLYMY